MVSQVAGQTRQCRNYVLGFFSARAPSLGLMPVHIRRSACSVS